MFIQCLFISSNTSFLNDDVLMFRVGEISSLGFWSKNVAQLLVKLKLYCIREGCTSLTLSALVMCKNAQIPQIKLITYRF